MSTGTTVRTAHVVAVLRGMEYRGVPELTLLEVIDDGGVIDADALFRIKYQVAGEGMFWETRPASSGAVEVRGHLDVERRIVENGEARRSARFVVDGVTPLPLLWAWGWSFPGEDAEHGPFRTIDDALSDAASEARNGSRDFPCNVCIGNVVWPDVYSGSVCRDVDAEYVVRCIEVRVKNDMFERDGGGGVFEVDDFIAAQGDLDEVVFDWAKRHLLAKRWRLMNVSMHTIVDEERGIVPPVSAVASPDAAGEAPCAIPAARTRLVTFDGRVLCEGSSSNYGDYVMIDGEPRFSIRARLRGMPQDGGIMQMWEWKRGVFRSHKRWVIGQDLTLKQLDAVRVSHGEEK